MSNMPTLRRRSRSVRSTYQITKAMEMISASKMRKASDAALASRSYAEAAEEMLAHLRFAADVSKRPLYIKRTVKRKLYIVVSSNRGLSGAFNKNIAKELNRSLDEDQKNNIEALAILIGRRANHFTQNLRRLKVIGHYDNLPDHPDFADLSPLLSTAIKAFSEKPYVADEVRLIYTKFVSHFKHEVLNSTLLPAGISELDKSIVKLAEFEPDVNTVLDIVTRRLLDSRLLQAYLESQASEQSARMIAMQSASDNAKDLIEDLKLTMNSLRQQNITNELAEIAAGAEVA